MINETLHWLSDVMPEGQPVTEPGRTSMLGICLRVLVRNRKQCRIKTLWGHGVLKEMGPVFPRNNLTIKLRIKLSLNIFFILTSDLYVSALQPITNVHRKKSSITQYKLHLIVISDQIETE